MLSQQFLIKRKAATAGVYKKATTTQPSQADQTATHHGIATLTGWKDVVAGGGGGGGGAHCYMVGVKIRLLWSSSTNQQISVWKVTNQNYF